MTKDTVSETAALRALLSETPDAHVLAEKAMTAVIQEAYVQGLSTRSVDDLVKAMGMTGVSRAAILSMARGTSPAAPPRRLGWARTGR